MNRSDASGQVLSARAKRVQRQEAAARRFAAILDAHELTRAQVAADLGISPQLVSDYANPEADANLSVADASGIANIGARRDLMDFIGGADLVAVQRHSASASALSVQDAARMLRAAMAAADSLLEALADGIVDPAEQRESLRKIDALICDAEGTRSALLALAVPRIPRAVGSR